VSPRGSYQPRRRPGRRPYYLAGDLEKRDGRPRGSRPGYAARRNPNPLAELLSALAAVTVDRPGTRSPCTVASGRSGTAPGCPAVVGTSRHSASGCFGCAFHHSSFNVGPRRGKGTARDGGDNGLPGGPASTGGSAAGGGTEPPLRPPPPCLDLVSRGKRNPRKLALDLTYLWLWSGRTPPDVAASGGVPSPYRARGLSVRQGSESPARQSRRRGHQARRHCWFCVPLLFRG
jgi:hypothetical protein